jgi:5-methylcytosine-specific restriction protein A
MSVKKEDFERELNIIFQKAIGNYIDVNAGELHRIVGGYPGADTNRMASCNNVMRKMMKLSDIVLAQPTKRQGASLTIRYTLPR